MFGKLDSTSLGCFVPSTTILLQPVYSKQGRLNPKERERETVKYTPLSSSLASKCHRRTQLLFPSSPDRRRDWTSEPPSSSSSGVFTLARFQVLLCSEIRHASSIRIVSFRTSIRNRAVPTSLAWPAGRAATMAHGPNDKKAERSYLSSAVDSINPWSSSRSSTSKPDEPAKSPSVANPGDHSSSPFYGQSLKNYPADCPPLKVQWFHAVDVCQIPPRM